MITAILYTSNTGTTKQYAEMLGKELDLPVYAAESAAIPKETEIIYLGWVMASEIKGYKKACDKYHIKAACGVCMGNTGSQIPEVREKNSIPNECAVFTLQGGFDLKNLHGIYKIMMNMMAKTVGKSLANKTDRTTEEDEMLDMMINGGNKVSMENLRAVLEWYGNQKKAV